MLPLGNRSSGFSTPPSYFDSLPAEITDRIQAEKNRKSQFFLLMPSFAIPSMAMVAGAIILLLFLKKEITPLEIQLADNEIEHVVANPELYDIDEDAITEKYLSSNISLESLDEDASEDEIRSYLEDNSESTSIINEY